MFASLALRAAIAAALAIQPAAAPVPVQRPTNAAPSTSQPTQPARDYAGVDAPEPPVQSGVAEATPAPEETAPPPQTLPPPGVTPLLPPQDPVEIEGPDDEDGPSYDPLVDSPEAIRARHVVHGGIVFTVVGAVLTLGGIAMSQAKVNVPGESEQPCNPRGDVAGNGCTPGGRSRAVAALVIPGAGLLAGGVTMLVLGKLQQRRLRASLQADKRGFMLGATLRF